MSSSARAKNQYKNWRIFENIFFVKRKGKQVASSSNAFNQVSKTKANKLRMLKNVVKFGKFSM